MPRTKTPAVPATITDQLRGAIRAALASGLTQTQIARASGVPQPSLSDFLRGRRISCDGVDKLARFLGLELRER